MASFDYMTPCSPSNFVGRKRQINLFKEQMDKVMAGEKTAKGIIIHGRSGIGKTSLIKKLVTVAENSSCYVLSKEIPLVGGEYFFDDLKAEIDDITKPKKPAKPIKRGKKGKKAPFVERSYAIVDRTKYLEDFFKKFTKGLDGNQKKIIKKGMKGIVIFIDNIEQLLYQDLDIAFDILKGTCERITTEIKGKPFNIPILFVVSAWERYYPKIKYILTNFEEIGIPTLNMANAKDLLDKNGSAAGISFGEEVKERLIETSLNVPQMILYNGKYISDNRGASSEITKEEWINLEAGIKIGFDRELEGISEEERKIYQAFSMESKNFAELITLAQGTNMQVKECESELQKLVSKNMVSKAGDYYHITLNNFWEHLRNSLGDIAIGAQAKGIMLIAENDADNGRLFSDFLHDEMERLRTDAVTAGLVAPIELIARGYERIADACFRYEYYNAAFEYILLAGESYVKINEIEKAALILERAANLFKAKDLGDYARDVLINTVETYSLLKDQEKVRELKLELAQLCRKKADESLAENSFPIARANFSRAQRLLGEVTEIQMLIDMIKGAADTFMEKQEYFYAWQFYGKLSDIYFNSGDTSTAADILKQAAGKFTGIGQQKFADKLNEQLSKKIPAGAV